MGPNSGLWSDLILLVAFYWCGNFSFLLQDVSLHNGNRFSWSNDGSIAWQGSCFNFCINDNNKLLKNALELTFTKLRVIKNSSEWNGLELTPLRQEYEITEIEIHAETWYHILHIFFFYNTFIPFHCHNKAQFIYHYFHLSIVVFICTYFLFVLTASIVHLSHCHHTILIPFAQKGEWVEEENIHDVPICAINKRK